MLQHLNVNVNVTTSRQLSLLCSHIQSICDAMEIPHLGEYTFRSILARKEEADFGVWCFFPYQLSYPRQIPSHCFECKVIFIKKNKTRLLNKISLFSQNHLNEKVDVMQFSTIIVIFLITYSNNCCFKKLNGTTQQIGTSAQSTCTPALCSSPRLTRRWLRALAGKAWPSSTRTTMVS